MTLYHYDRLGLLTSGMSLELSADYSLIEQNSLGAETLLQDLFPDGLSQHGLTYMRTYAQPGLFCVVDAAKESFGRFSSHMQEQTLELARRAFYPMNPSRFQSIFCLTNVNDIEKWQEIITSEGKLFEIESLGGPFMEFDSRWLRGGITVWDDGYIGRSTPLEIDFARKYWSGCFSENPRLEVLAKLPVKLGKEIEI